MNSKVNISNRAGATFPVRRLSIDYDAVPEYWANNSAALTHFMTALSALFPAGEKLFIDSVRALRHHPSVKDNAELQKEISAFIGQEAMHTHEHIGFNASAQKYGHDVALLEKLTSNYIQAGRKYAAIPFKLFGLKQEMLDIMGTTALEHFTASLAVQLLENENFKSVVSTNETMAYLWFWHAIEENEHKAVAFDVFENIFGKGVKAYLARTSALLVAMVFLFVAHNHFLGHLLYKDKKLNLKNLAEIYNFAYRPGKGIIIGMASEMASYFRPSFHPNDSDTTSLLTYWKNQLGFQS
ncbi:metal-dependent hydrolase [Acinetobacter rudis]|uniref:Metal-dependent hydrolase n=1 Tax=Acinetobacter rudis CIP 110305 TaxID=421052 RepID=S3MS06_9GAMM|nr:metal-dependent hydrolase [Acinetobacter rudis]EPF70397.1 hypothetical protein F945_03420 [Acinetobacter rudis CIP 110305]